MNKLLVFGLLISMLGNLGLATTAKESCEMAELGPATPLLPKHITGRADTTVSIQQFSTDTSANPGTTRVNPGTHANPGTTHVKANRQLEEEENTTRLVGRDKWVIIIMGMVAILELVAMSVYIICKALLPE